MKTKHILAVGAAGVTLFGTSSLSAALFEQETVYAVETEAKPTNPDEITQTSYRTSDGTSIPNVSNDEKYRSHKEISGYKYIRSGFEFERGKSIWVHYYAKDASSTGDSSNNNGSGNNNGSTTNSNSPVKKFVL